MKNKSLTLFSIAVAILCIAARTITLIYTTQSGTGFFISRLAPLGICLSVVIFLLTLVAFIFAFTSNQTARSPFKPSGLSAMACIVLGITILLYSFGFNSHTAFIHWQHTLETLTGIAAGVWFILYGLTAFTNLRLPNVTAILPCIHFITRLVVVFGGLSTSALVAEHVFSLAYHVCAMVFMLNLGRVMANEPSKSSQKTFFPISVLTFIFTCTSVFSRLIMLIISKTQMIHGETPLDITGIALSIFIILISADICKNDNIKIKEAVSDEF